MSIGSGSKPYVPSAPAPLAPISDPVPTPTDADESVRMKSEAARKKLLARKGRASTILTDTLGQPMNTGQTLLGYTG